MDARLDRIDQLRHPCLSNGVDVDAVDGLQQLNDWFAQAVEANPTNPERLANRWYGVVNDIGLLLGERTIAGSGGKLRWDFYTWGRRDAAYHRHVIMGFDVPNPKFSQDFDRGGATHGHRIIKGFEVERDLFVRSLELALSKVDAGKSSDTS